MNKPKIKHVYNFGAGPSMLPLPILKEAQKEFLNWQNLGMSILEVNHRSAEFRTLLDNAENTLRRLLNIPANYHVLFLSGPARMLFSMIPLNFLTAEGQGAYLVTGVWSAMALREAQKLKKAYAVASGETSGFTSVPPRTSWDLSSSATYFYYTPNETVNGVYCPKPQVPTSTPIIADMTSCLLAEPISVADYALIFAGAQKNIANAGLTLAIIRDDWVNAIKQTNLPSFFDFRLHVAERSLANTPPTFNCYLAAKMFAWIEAEGGVKAMYALNQRKAAKLYHYIDESSFYTCSVDKPYRSLFNICFNLPEKALEPLFIEEAKHHYLIALAGHRLVGGLRASLYNAMPIAGVNRLIDFMQDFAKRYAQ